MENIKVDVIIPAYHPGKEFSTLIERLTKQTFPIHRIIVMNTEETYWNKELEEKFSILEDASSEKNRNLIMVQHVHGQLNFQMRMLWYL
mgnify:CR=1 FL=1